MKEEDKEIFKRDSNEYSIRLNPVKDYISQAATFVETRTGKSKEDSIAYVKNLMVKTEVKNPETKFRYRDDKGNLSFKTETLTDYIKETLESNEVMVPSFTTYLHPSKKKSIHANFLDINIQKRKSDKHNAFKYKQEGNADKYLHYNTLQKVRKIFNNSLSGAYASKSTILYNPSAHYTLTSMTRSVASIGNAVSESVIAGNKHFGTPELAINYIVSIINNVYMNSVEITVNEFNLHQPTPEEVMDMMLYSTRNYWTDLEKENVILSTLKNLNGYQLAAVMYVNDLFHLKKYNPDFVKNMLKDISRKVLTGSTEHQKDIDACKEGSMNLVHHICMEDIQGKSINYKELEGTELLTILASTAKNVNEQLFKYRKIFRTFFTTDILPIDIANIRSMLRDAIVLSDTDSTCGSYDKWVEWYFGEDKFSPEAVALSATVMTINTQVIDHNIKVFAKNMNIQDELTDLLKMKNEFFWTSFMTANVSKHYAAEVLIQEGNVFAQADLELKGVHLIASAGNQDIVKRAHAMSREINSAVSKGEKVDAIKYLTIVADAERHMLSLIDSGDINIFKKEKIKDPSAYKVDDKSKTNYFHHMLWEEVFKEKYGDPGDPEYMVLKISTDLKTKKKLTDYVESIEDQEIKFNLINSIKKHKKDALGTMKVPVAIASGKGIPIEMIKAVDRKRMVLDSLNVYYIVLESCGLYRKESLLFSEMGY